MTLIAATNTTVTSNVLAWPPKDPDEKLDYAFVWTNRLVDDTIETTTATVKKGSIVVDLHGVYDVSPYKTRQVTVTWFTGGKVGETNEILLHIVTHEGRILEQTVYITVQNR